MTSLDLVLATITGRAVRHLFHRIGAADRLDDLFLFVVAMTVRAMTVRANGPLASWPLASLAVAVMTVNVRSMGIVLFAVFGMMGFTVRLLIMSFLGMRRVVVVVRRFRGRIDLRRGLRIRVADARPAFRSRPTPEDSPSRRQVLPNAPRGRLWNRRTTSEGRSPGCGSPIACSPARFSAACCVATSAGSLWIASSLRLWARSRWRLRPATIAAIAAVAVAVVLVTLAAARASSSSSACRSATGIW